MSKGFLLYELLVALFLFMTGVVVVTQFLSCLVQVHDFIEKRARVGLSLYQGLQTNVIAGNSDLPVEYQVLVSDTKKAVVQSSTKWSDFSPLVFTTWQIKEKSGTKQRTVSEIELVSYERA